MAAPETHTLTYPFSLWFRKPVVTTGLIVNSLFSSSNFWPDPNVFQETPAAACLCEGTAPSWRLHFCVGLGRTLGMEVKCLCTAWTSRTGILFFWSTLHSDSVFHWVVTWSHFHSVSFWPIFWNAEASVPGAWEVQDTVMEEAGTVWELVLHVKDWGSVLWEQWGAIKG